MSSIPDEQELKELLDKLSEGLSKKLRIHNPQLYTVSDQCAANNYLADTNLIKHLNLANRPTGIALISPLLRCDNEILRSVALAYMGRMDAVDGKFDVALHKTSCAARTPAEGDAKTYILTEMAVVLRMSEVETTAHKILEMALPTAQEESLRSRINLNLAGIIGHSNSRRAHVILEQVYNSNAGTCLQVTAMRYLGNTLVADGDMEAADNALSDALALSDIFGKEQESAKVINDIGWMLIKQKRYNRAESLFLKLLRKRLRPYIRVMAIQNLAYLHFQQEHYNKAVYHHIQSLKLCSRQGMTGMMYEDYYKLGLCSELLGHPGEALRYYEAGFTYLKHEIEMGLPLIGYRRKLVSSYNDFLGRLGHSKQFMFS